MTFEPDTAVWGGTYTSWIELSIYPAAGSSAAARVSHFKPPLQAALDSYADGAEQAPQLMNVSYNKQMFGGSLSASLRASTHEGIQYVQHNVQSGDWVDAHVGISDSSGVRFFHVFRGMITAVGNDQFVTGGATSVDFHLHAASFETVLAGTEIFGDYFRDNQLVPLLWAQMAGSDPGKPIILPHWQAVYRAFVGYLGSQDVNGRALWELPVEMPKTFVHMKDEVEFPHMSSTMGRYRLGRYPKRYSISSFQLGAATPFGSSVGAAMMSWADTATCDLFADLVDRNSLAPLVDPRGQPESTTRMAFIYRDKPFPGRRGADGALVHHGWWDGEGLSQESQTAMGERLRVATYYADPQEIMQVQVSQSLDELVNMIYYLPMLGTGLEPLSRLLSEPLWDNESIARYGVKKLEIVSPWIITDTPPTGESSSALITSMLAHSTLRDRLTELNVLNHIYYKGSITLRNPRPDIRVGQRLVLTHPINLEYHVDTISMTWSKGLGVQMNMSVSRGVAGTPKRHARILDQLLGGFSVPPRTGPVKISGFSSFEEAFPTIVSELRGAEKVELESAQTPPRPSPTTTFRTGPLTPEERRIGDELIRLSLARPLPASLFATPAERLTENERDLLQTQISGIDDVLED